MGYSNDQSGLESQLAYSIEFPKDPDEFREKVYDVYQKIVNAVNAKSGGLYIPVEKATSERYFEKNNTQQFRNIYRMTIIFGALPNATSKSVPHNIIGWNNQYRLVHAYGAANDPADLEAIPIPNQNILLTMNSTNVTVTTTTNLSNYTLSTIVLEYSKGL